MGAGAAAPHRLIDIGEVTGKWRSGGLGQGQLHGGGGAWEWDYVARALTLPLGQIDAAAATGVDPNALGTYPRGWKLRVVSLLPSRLERLAASRRVELGHRGEAS